MSNVNPPSPGSQLPRVVLLYKRNAPADEHLLGVLERKLIQEGFPVFVDRHLSLGVDWAKEIEQRVRLADAVVPLLSASSAQSEMLAFEIENAHEAAQAQHGHPRLLPIRVNHTGPLPEELAGILDPIQYILWEGEHDDERVAAELVASLKNLPPARPVIRVVPAKGLRLTPRPAVQPRPATVTPAPAPAGPLPLEPVGGAVPLNSEFYTTRSVDAEMRAALTRYDSIILVKGARQIGKTSLLARGLQFARERGAKVALTDFQKFNASNLEDVSGFFVTLAESLADQLDIAVPPTDVWDPQRGPSVNFERYIRREVLKNLNAPLVWGLDEVDRLFTYPYCSEVFGLFRSWHNERALDPSGPWAGLTLAITYATEAHLFITDMNQSPFNVGTKLAVEDFTLAQAGELNTKHGDPLGGTAGVKRFMDLVSGHPYLVRRGLQEMTSKKMGIDAFEAQASKDDGVYGDHLRRILVLLAKDPVLLQVMSGVIRGKPCPNSESFYRLRSSGIVAGDSPAHVHPRCKLYSDYLLRHI